MYYLSKNCLTRGTCKCRMVLLSQQERRNSMISVEQINSIRKSNLEGTPSKRHSYIPLNYEALYQVYFARGPFTGCNTQYYGVPLAQLLCPYTGDSDTFSTFPNTLYLYCLEKDVLTLFDEKKGNFGGILFLMARNRAEKERALARNPVVKASSIHTSQEEEFIPGSYDIDAIRPPQRSLLSGCITQIDMEIVASFAKDALARGITRRDKSLQPLLGLLYSGYTYPEIAQSLGVTLATVHNWVAHLRCAFN